MELSRYWRFEDYVYTHTNTFTVFSTYNSVTRFWYFIDHFSIDFFIDHCRRLDAVEVFRNEVFHCEMIVGMLKKCQDLERILQKVSNNKN